MRSIQTQVRTARLKLIVMTLSVLMITIGCASELAQHDLSTIFGALFLSVICGAAASLYAAYTSYTRTMQRVFQEYERATRHHTAHTAAAFKRHF